jgi:hypothetical protein
MIEDYDNKWGMCIVCGEQTNLCALCLNGVCHHAVDCPTRYFKDEVTIQKR